MNEMESLSRVLKLVDIDVSQLAFVRKFHILCNSRNKMSSIPCSQLIGEKNGKRSFVGLELEHIKCLHCLRFENPQAACPLPRLCFPMANLALKSLSILLISSMLNNMLLDQFSDFSSVGLVLCFADDYVV